MSDEPRRFRWRWGDEGAPITPDPISSPPFSYGTDKITGTSKDVFKMDDIPQCTPGELQRLFGRNLDSAGYLIDPQANMSQWEAKQETRSMTVKWFAAQLKFYGIPFRKSAPKKADLTFLLKSAVRAGMVRRI